MPDREMTPTEAIIILDRLNTEERIEVDREELREAVKAAQKALNIVADLPPNHGRLIDADELIGYLNEWLSDPVALFGFTRIINHQPTIIEAEVSE